MKAFLVGLVFLIAAALIAALGALLFPLILILGVLLRVLLVCLLAVFFVWALGKFIIFFWEEVKRF